MHQLERVLEDLLRFSHLFQSVLDLSNCEICSLLVGIDSIVDSHSILVQVYFHLSKHSPGVFGNGVGESKELVVSRSGSSLFWAFESNDGELIIVSLFEQSLEQLLSVRKGCLVDLAFLLV
jgi:hypothetical protein